MTIQGEEWASTAFLKPVDITKNVVMLRLLTAGPHILLLRDDAENLTIIVRMLLELHSQPQVYSANQPSAMF